jgi:hypothetical protein
MEPIDSNTLIQFLKNNIQPLPDAVHGLGYRASVYLIDGTYLPCVIFRNPEVRVSLAIRRFKEERKSIFNFQSKSGVGYYNIVENFVTKGNAINVYDISKVHVSRFAFPLIIQNQIRGETTMGWTGFAAKMKDGKYFGFGTSFLWEFFDMPDNYSTDDIEQIVNHSYVLKSGELRSHRQGPLTRPEEYKDAIVYREKPYFECFVNHL